jgi:hypothetical protein
MLAIAKLFAPWALVAALGALLWTWTPMIGPAARHGRVSAERDAWRMASEGQERAARGWKASFIAAETLRAGEAATARAASASQIQQCAARVAEARASARAIETIVTREPTYDQNRCPVRELVDPGQLRDALRPGDADRDAGGRGL